MLETYWPTARDKANATESEIKYSNWYNEAEKIVLSKSLTQNDLKKTTVLPDNIAENIRKIKNRDGKNILMFGSPTAFETLNKLELIDEYWIIQYPVLFGKGIPFFNRAHNLKRFKLSGMRQFSNGELAIHYKTD
jgi:dihydrofolate reductase